MRIRLTPPTVGLLMTAVLVPAGLLSTNFTFHLPVPETLPIVFIGAGFFLAIVYDRLAVSFFLLPVAMLVYATVGLGFGAGVASLRLLAAAVVFFVGIQLADEPRLPLSCRIVIYVLLGLRLVSLALPGPINGLYQVLGLRAASTFGDGRAVLFAEPSYLATAVFACWAMGRRAHTSVRNGIKFLDLAAIAILLLSFSASAALYAVVGWLIVIRRNFAMALATGLLVVLLVSSTIVLESDRVMIFIRAIKAVAESGRIVDFIHIDPSSSWRLTSALLALTSGWLHPLGQLKFEMTTNLLMAAEAHDKLGLISAEPLTNRFIGNLQASSVPLQLLVFGGIPLFVAFVAGTTKSVLRLLRDTADRTSSLLMAAVIIVGCLLQSQLTSPFLYVAIAVGASRAVAPRDEASPEQVAGT